MKNLLLLLVINLCLLSIAQAQEFADFEVTSTNEGTGTFTNATLSNFNWTATGTINGQVQILNNETFDDGSLFENNFGQADNAENIRTQIYPNGVGTIGTPIISKSKLTIIFDQLTPASGWGFCIVDIDVENCLISAIDEDDNPVSNAEIDNWLLELFDTDLIMDGVNIPKWDSTNAALLGSGTPSNYIVYNDIVMGGIPDSEAASASFMPNIPIKSLTIDYENLQDTAFVSYHFYIASQSSTGIDENEVYNFTLFPNPAVKTIKIHTNISDLLGTTVEIFDINGKKQLKKLIPKGIEIFEIDISHLNTGIFYCQLINSNRVIVKKLIIQ